MVIEGETGGCTQFTEVLPYTEDRLQFMMQEKHRWHSLPCITFILQLLTEMLISIVSGAIKIITKQCFQAEVSIVSISIYYNIRNAKNG
jgi:hypothetical protein